MRFFGKLPIIRGDKTELYLIAGAAWRSEATDEELTADDDLEELFGMQSADEKRAEATKSYLKGKLGECYSQFRQDGQPK